MSSAPPLEQPPLVLIVDDNADARELYTVFLQQQGFRVVTAMSGLSAIAKIAVLTPSVVLMDLAMPDMDGWDAIRELKASPRTRNVPVIVLSAHDLPRYRELAVIAGCSGYLTKPLAPDHLLSEVRRLLAG